MGRLTELEWAASRTAVLLGRWIPAAISLQHHRGLVWGRKEASAAEPSVHGAEAKLGAGRAPPPRTEREGGSKTRAPQCSESEMS